MMKYFLILFFVLASSTLASEITTLEQAKVMAKEKSKRILMEFGREDCEYCQKAEDEFKTNRLIKESLDKVIHIKLNVALSDQYEIAKQYKVGYTYPVYIMTTPNGEVLNRWTGFYGANRFLTDFNRVLLSKLTIPERIKRYETSPSFEDAEILAIYYGEINDYLNAWNLYKEAYELAPMKYHDYPYKIFVSAAEACWNGLLPFSEVMAAADKVEPDNIINVAKIITNCARRAGTTDQVAKYIDRALDIVSPLSDEKSRELKYELLAEQALYVENDLNKALRIIKISLGDGWQDDPARFFKFAEWCQVRNINLEQAEQFARKAADRASAGKLKGKVFNTLAEICYQQGKTVDAIRFTEQAIDEFPSNEYYHQQLTKFKNELKK
ncbi:MAG: thioredoxin family protein [Candidatus Zixiibacteriota bacterium]